MTNYPRKNASFFEVVKVTLKKQIKFDLRPSCLGYGRPFLLLRPPVGNQAPTVSRSLYICGVVFFLTNQADYIYVTAFVDFGVDRQRTSYQFLGRFFFFNCGIIAEVLTLGGRREEVFRVSKETPSYLSNCFFLQRRHFFSLP